MAELSVNKPGVPYKTFIPGAMVAGKRVFVRGYVPPNADRFRVDFWTSQGDVAIHINPRFREGCVVRNTQSGGGWGTEERHGGLPMKAGVVFEMCITAQPDHFKVAINGEHVFDYHHRIPLNIITQFSVEGDVDLNNVTFTGNFA